MIINTTLYLIGVNPSEKKEKNYVMLKFCDSTSNIFDIVSKRPDDQNLELFNLYNVELSLTSHNKYGLRLEAVNVWR